jgi:hypothetical protein
LSLQTTPKQQQQRTEFIQGITSFLEQAGQIVAAQPMAAPLMGQLLMFGARGFRIGRDLDDALEEFVKKAEAMAAQPKPPQARPGNGQGPGWRSDRPSEDRRRRSIRPAAHGDGGSAAPTRTPAGSPARDAEGSSRSAGSGPAVGGRRPRRPAEAAIAAMLEKFKAELQAKTQIEVAEIAAGATVDAAQISGAQAGDRVMPTVRPAQCECGAVTEIVRSYADCAMRDVPRRAPAARR